MRSILFAIVSMMTAIAFCQPTIDWQKTYGGSGNDVLYAADQNNGSGFYIGGGSNSDISGEKNQNSKGLSDFWVINVNQGGQILWQKSIGGSLDDVLYSLVTTTDGPILAGISYSDASGDKTEDSRGYGDFWVVKMNADGNIQWQRTIGSNNLDAARSIAKTSDGGYIVGGTSNSDALFEKTEPSRGIVPSLDYWIVKLDANGNIQWQKTYGGDGIDDLYTIKETADGGFIVGGISSSGANYDKTEETRGDLDYWILKLDNNGNIVWQKTYGGSQPDYLRSILEDGQGNFYIGGFSFSGISGDKSEALRGVSDFWVLKLDPLGNMIWQRTIGGSEGEYLYNAISDGDGRVLLSGYSASDISGEKTETPGSADMWLLSINEDGQILWQKTLGGNQYDAIYDVRKISENKYMLSGNSRSPISGEKNESCRGETDYWLVMLNTENLSIDKNDLNASIDVYPNPINGILNIALPSGLKVSDITISDTSGKLLQFDKLSDTKLYLWGQSGLYFLNIKTSNGATSTFKIVKN